MVNLCAANDPREELIENSAEQLNYLYDYNNEQNSIGADDQWYIYFLGGTVEDLKYIQNDTDSVDKIYLRGLNEQLTRINESSDTAVYVAFTLYEKTIVTPLFPKGLTSLEMQKSYIESYFKGVNDQAVDQFSIYTKHYQDVLEKIYERSWLVNLEKKNVLLPFSMYSKREIQDVSDEGTSFEMGYNTYTLYAPEITPDFDSTAFKKLFDENYPLLGKSPIEQKMERLVGAIDDYFIYGKRPEAKPCENLFASDNYKNLVDRLGKDDTWVLLIDEDPCILDKMYSAGNDWGLETQFEKDLAMVVCTPLYMALGIPLIAVAGEVVIINALRKIGEKKIKDASVAMIYSSLTQFSYNYYFNSEVAAITNQENRIQAAVDNIDIKEVLGEGLKESISPKTRDKAAIGCIVSGLKFKDDEWYDITKLEKFDFGDCIQEILTEYGTFIATETASPVLKRLKELIKNNPRQFVKGFREILHDAGLPVEMKEQILCFAKTVEGRGR